jgi:hypothetical protein
MLIAVVVTMCTTITINDLAVAPRRNWMPISQQEMDLLIVQQRLGRQRTGWMLAKRPYSYGCLVTFATFSQARFGSGSRTSALMQGGQFVRPGL